MPHWSHLAVAINSSRNAWRSAPVTFHNPHPDRGRPAAAAGIVDLRAVRDDPQDVHLRAQVDMVAWPARRADEGQRIEAVVLDNRHAAKEVQVRYDVTPAELV